MLNPHRPASSPLPHIAVIGSGISGLSAAWHLRGRARVSLFEADNRLGGHANTVDVVVGGQTIAVDTGFLVCNQRTYPGLLALFEALEVELAPSDMGFSVQVRDDDERAPLEWSGTGLRGLFAQPRNALSPRFWGMLRDILRFNRLCTQLANRQADAGLHEGVGAFLLRHGFGAAFRDHYLVPMVACIWSCSPRQMMDFPIGTLIRFCHNHGLLQVTNQPPWFTVVGGSRRYVEKVVAGVDDVRLSCPVHAVTSHGAGQGVTVRSARGDERFDAVLLACHSDQSLQLLGHQASDLQREVLSAIRYQPNRAVLHTDTSLMPQQRAAWAAWNYESHGAQASVCLHYWLNALQPLPTTQPVLVSLNPLREPAAEQVLQSFDYAHPVFDAAAIHAQSLLSQLEAECAHTGIAFAGAWMRYGFHEDGFQAGKRAAHALCALPLSHARQNPPLYNAQPQTDAVVA